MNERDRNCETHSLSAAKFLTFLVIDFISVFQLIFFNDVFVIPALNALENTLAGFFCTVFDFGTHFYSLISHDKTYTEHEKK